MSYLNTILNFVNHRFAARRWNSFHSPYLFKLFSYCCDDRNDFPVFENIENRRLEFIRLKEKIKRSDFGAGSSVSTHSPEKYISTIAEESLSLPFQCRFLYRLIRMTKPGIIIEFGTSLGIATSYLAKANPECQIYTIEGDPILSNMAQKLFNDLELKNTRIINSIFEDFINQELKKIQKVDFVFLDGNHKGGRLNYYYRALQPYFTEHTIMMVDDIYWSKDMHEGWNKLIAMPEVTQSVDCFQFGLLFFSRDFMNKENHKIGLPLKAFIPIK